MVLHKPHNIISARVLNIVWPTLFVCLFGKIYVLARKIRAYVHIQIPFHLSQARGVTAAVFQLPAKLHLTLGVMRLFSAEEEVHLLGFQFQKQFKFQ